MVNWDLPAEFPITKATTPEHSPQFSLGIRRCFSEALGCLLSTAVPHYYRVHQPLTQTHARGNAPVALPALVAPDDLRVPELAGFPSWVLLPSGLSRPYWKPRTIPRHSTGRNSRLSPFATPGDLLLELSISPIYSNGGVGRTLTGRRGAPSP